LAAWPIIASLAPPAPLAGTRLIFTEQAAFLGGYNDLAGREEGTRVALDNLDVELKLEPGRA
jgi:hypothetical protein